MERRYEHIRVIGRGHALVIGRVRTIMLALGLLAATLVIAALALDEGEVVTLLSRDDGGMEHETQLWIVQIDGTPHLRAASGRVEWLDRIEAEPIVTLEREDREPETFLAMRQSDPALRQRVNRAMAEKYGLADRIWGLLSDRSGALPIRLAPAPPGARPEQRHATHAGGAP